jgi:hypothetical protein
MNQVFLRWLPTRQCHVVLLLLALALLALLALAGVVPASFFAVGAVPMMFMGDTAAVPGTDTQTGGASAKVGLPWRRIREKSPVTFQNVAANATAYAEIPRYALTLLGMTMTLGGTVFTKAQITMIRVRLGSHVLWQITGPDLNTVNSYLLGNTLSYIGLLNPTRLTMLEIDFTDPRNRHLAGEMIGGIDMTRLPQGKLRVEVTIGGATAPTLDANIAWGIPQNSGSIKKYLQFPYFAGVAGRNSIPLNVDGALISRLFFMYAAGVDWCTPVTAPTAAAFSNNVGNGTFGTIVIPAGAQVGTYKVLMLAATLGILQRPDGRFVPTHIATGVAFAPAADPQFTLTAGGTPFTAGDGFDIVVSDVSEGNINRVEIKKNGRTVWDMTDHEARFLQQKYDQAPQSRMYVVDFTADKNSEGILATADASSMEYNEFVTVGADQQMIYAEVIDDPMSN